MYKHLIALLLIFAFAVSAADKIPAIYTSREDFVKAVGHIQGGCVSKDAIYLSHMKGIFKFDHKGKLIKHASTVSHTGDLCYYDGKIYATIAYYDKARKGKGAIKEYNSELEELRSYEVDQETDGITCLNGILYFGIGPYSQKLHRGNRIAKMPADFSSKPEIFEIDHGYLTNFGPQTLTNDGKNIFMSFYSSQKGACHSAVFTPDLKLVNTLHFAASIGFDLFPGLGDEKAPVFIKVLEFGPKKQKERRIDFYKYENGQMVNITQYAGDKK